jgi:hypothetical protein
VHPLTGCGRDESKLKREMLMFGVEYHNIAAGQGKLSVTDKSIAQMSKMVQMEWENRGPSQLERDG